MEKYHPLPTYKQEKKLAKKLEIEKTFKRIAPKVEGKGNEYSTEADYLEYNPEASGIVRKGKVFCDNQFNPFLDWILNQVLRFNRDVRICITGATGTGKSYLALRLAEALSDAQEKKFTIDNVLFRGVKFINKVTDSKKGDVIIFDESGVSMSARRSMSKNNLLLGATMQTMRYKNNIVIFTLPTLEWLDSTARELFHLILETKKINYYERLVYAKVKFMVHKAIKKHYGGRTILKYPRIMITNYGKFKIKYVGFGLPSRKLINDYENKKDKYLRNFYLRAQRELELQDKMEGVDDGKMRIPLTDMEKAVWNLSKTKLPIEKLARKLKTTPARIKRWQKSIFKKGYDIDLGYLR